MKNNKAQQMYELYKEGYSLSDVGNVFNVTRQSVYDMFKRRNYELRSIKKKPFIVYNGLKFTINKNGYYECTTQDRLMLHNLVYETEKGSIPEGNVIHHLDNIKINNKIENLKPISPSEHSKLHNSVSGWNGMCKKVICVETKEIFNSINELAKKHNQYPSNVSRYYIDGKRKLNGYTYERID
tara:strand:- start:6561 stop:7109 length:549 start_codon:yes stop_codon:yes gene_type:complete